MPLNLSPCAWAIWMTTIAFQPLLAFLLARKGLWRKWASLFLFLCVKSAGSFALVAIWFGVGDPDLRAALYFYTYWGFAFLAGIVQVWMVIQIGCAMAGVSLRVRCWIASGIWTCAFGELAVFAHITHAARLPAWGRISQIVLDLDKSIDLAWLSTFMLAVLACETLGIRGFNPVRGISIGYAIMALGATCSSWMLGFIRDVALISNVNGFMFLLALSTWAYTLQQSQESFPQNYNPERLQKVIAAYQSCLGIIQRTIRTRP